MHQPDGQSVDAKKQRDEFVDLAVCYLEGMLAVEGVHRLESYLESDGKWRDLFARITIQSRLLAESIAKTLVNDGRAAQQEITTADLLREVMDQQDAARAKREAEEREEHRRRTEAEALRQESYQRLMGLSPADDKPRTRHYVIPTPLFYGSIAALVAIAALIVYPLLPNFSGSAAHQRETSTENTTLATIAESNGATWTDDELPTAPGGRLPTGALSLTRGTLQLTMDNGAEVFIAAPAEFELRSDELMFLRRGEVAAHVPKRAQGFTVLGSGMKVVDLGTEFGVSVKGDRSGEVHVFLGEVRTATLDAADNELDSMQLGHRQSVSIDAAAGQIKAISHNSDKFEWALPHLALLNKNLVKNPGFEDDRAGKTWEDEQQSVNGRYYYSENVSISSWNEDSQATVIGYQQAASSDYIKPWRNRVPRDRGDNYYVAFVQDARIWQRIDVEPLSSAIDQDMIDFTFSAWLGSFRDNVEYLDCKAMFLDEAGEELDTSMLKPVKSADRDGKTGFMYRDTTGRVPAGTRTVLIELVAVEGPPQPGVTDGYADNINFTLSVQE